MIEKRNDFRERQEKAACGDSRGIDDIVDFAVESLSGDAAEATTEDDDAVVSR